MGVRLPEGEPPEPSTCSRLTGVGGSCLYRSGPFSLSLVFELGLISKLHAFLLFHYFLISNTGPWPVVPGSGLSKTLSSPPGLVMSIQSKEIPPTPHTHKFQRHCLIALSSSVPVEITLF